MISVIIPTFNSKKTVINAINSVLGQKTENLELIVVDDGSTDGTMEALSPLAEKGAIRYFYKPNGGVSSARNYGIEKSKGDLIGFLDADDIYLPEMLPSCVNEIEKKNLDLVTVNCYVTHLDEHGNKKDTETVDYDWLEQTPDDLFLSFMARGAIGGPHKALFRREVFKDIGFFDTSLKVYEDLDFWIRVARAEFRWSHLHIPLLEVYRTSTGTLFTDSGEFNQDYRLKVLKKYQDEAIKLSQDMRNILAEQLWNFGRSYLLDYKSYKKGMRCLWDSFIMKPDLSRIFGPLKRKLFA